MSRRIIFIWPLFLFAGCSESVTDKAKDILDVKNGLQSTQAGSLTVEQVLQLGNWDLQGQPLVDAKGSTEETCITWQFNHIDSFRVGELGKFVIKKGADEVPAYYSSVQDCSDFLGTLQLFFEKKISGARFLISSIERKATVMNLPTRTWIDFNDDSWDVELVNDSPYKLFITDNEIEVELTGEGLTQARNIRVGDDTCSWDSIGCWVHYPIQRFLRVRLPRFNTNYDLRFSLVLENGQNTNPKSIQIWHDSVSPTGGKVLIADYLTGSSEITKNKEVRLRIAVDDSESAFMYVTNDRDCQVGGEWESVSDRGWTLSTLNERSHVYVKFRDSAGNETECYSGSIVHDDTPPIGGISLNFGASTAYEALATLSISSSGASKMYLNDGASCSSSSTRQFESIATAKKWTLVPIQGMAFVSIKFKDDAGNESTCYTAQIETPSVQLRHEWLEGYYFRKSTVCSIPQNYDHRITKSALVEYPPFTNLLLLSFVGCSVSKTGASSYLCDHQVLNSNCKILYGCTLSNEGFVRDYDFGGKIDCEKPNSVP